jgi:hypothetical protein
MQHDAESLADASSSEWQRCKRSCAHLCAHLRCAIKDRDKLFKERVDGKGRTGRDFWRKEWILMKSECRKKLAAFRAEVSILEAIYLSEKKKLGESSRVRDEPEPLKFKRELLELVMQYLEGMPRRPTRHILKPM